MKNVRGDLPLHEAVISRRKDLVLWLLSQRPDTVNASNNDGRCPIHLAALNNNVEMVKVGNILQTFTDHLNRFKLILPFYRF
jgi:ankyrin repeat protein